MFVVVAYDVADDRRRWRIMKLLEGYGEHLQESVFAADLERSDYEKMLRGLRRLADLQADNVQIYHLCATDLSRSIHMGVGAPVRQRPKVVIV